MSDLPTSIRNQALHVAQTGSALWQSYLENGPGNLPEDFYLQYQKAANGLETALQEDSSEVIQQRLTDLNDLTQRCAKHPQGLCFLSGEAGLVPRKDQHEAIEGLLSYFRDLASP